MTTLTTPSLAWQLRPVTSQDRDLLIQIYGSTRLEELAVTNWSAEQQQAFILMQFNAQDTYYRQVYPQATYDIIEWNGQDAGRLYVNRTAKDLRIIDISLLPAYRGQGLGSAILAELLEEAKATHRSVGIHVETFNPAQRLYERLGFQRKHQEGVYWYMEHTPDSVLQTSTTA